MPTSYTTNLRLALPATGELSGTWGNTVNNAITTLLDDSIGGYVAIAVSAADQALTANNGLTDQSRQAVLSVSNTYGAAVSLYAPPVEKLYVIYNADSTYNLTFKVATVANGVVPSGGSTVVIPPLKRVIVYVDTFNVVEQMNYVAGDITLAANVILGDASTDTVRVNGYMGVGGAAPLSDRSLNVAPTALTGASQYGASFQPTATSSATSDIIGLIARGSTAASVFTVTNSVGLYALNAVKGAGSTITNQHGVYIADQTQGTNNYGITSAVSAGANKWNIHANGTAQNYFAGNVGIGTSLPAIKLQVEVEALTNTYASSSTTLASPDVIAGFVYQGLVDNTPALTRHYDRPTTSIWYQGNTGGIASYSSAFVIGNRTGSTAYSERLRITSAGNVGIGTTTPAYLLDVEGTSTAIVAAKVQNLSNGASATSRFILINDAANSVSFSYFSSTNATYPNGAVITNASAAGVIAFGTNSGERMRIDSGGDVGIGTTDPTGGYAWSGATRVLGISGDTSAAPSANGVIALTNNRATPGATDNFGILGFTSQNSVAGQKLKAYIAGIADGAGGVTGGYGGVIGFYTKPDNSVTAATERMRITNAGDVLVGTSTAGLGKLRVFDSGTQAIELTNTDSNAIDKSGCITVSRYTNTNTPFTLIRGTSAAATSVVSIGGGSSSAAPATDILFFTSALSGVAGTGTEAMRIDSSGYVGIGTNNPSAPLEVSTTGVVAAQFISTSASTVGARVYLYHDSASPANDDAISEIRFNANNSLGAATIYGQIVAVAKNVTSGSHSTQLQFNTTIAGSLQATMVLDAEGNVQTTMGALVVKAPAHGSFAAAATLTNADLKKYIINTTGTTYTLTMPTGATMETLVDWYTTNLGFDFYIVNTASGTITLGANSNTTLGSLTIATGTSAQFRIRRTGASAFTIYRLS